MSLSHIAVALHAQRLCLHVILLCYIHDHNPLQDTVQGFHDPWEVAAIEQNLSVEVADVVVKITTAL